MKLTTQRLTQLIKEELEAVINEEMDQDEYVRSVTGASRFKSSPRAVKPKGPPADAPHTPGQHSSVVAVLQKALDSGMYDAQQEEEIRNQIHALTGLNESSYEEYEQMIRHQMKDVPDSDEKEDEIRKQTQRAVRQPKKR